MSSQYKDLAAVAPYFDDYDAKKNFMRILFNPSRAVQARELTQLQTILHNQSNQTAKHLFKNNTTISGARISTIENKPAAYLERFQVDNDKTFDEFGDVNNYGINSGDVFENENTVVFDETWVGVTFGNASTAAASDKQITITQYAYDEDAGQSYPIIYFDFSGQNVEPGEIFYPLGTDAGSFPAIAIGWPSKDIGGLSNVVATDEENPFKAMAASCESGVIYSKDHFLTVEENEIIASNTPSEGIIEIGYRVVQDIVTENNTELVEADELDASEDQVPLGNKLRDPASGSRNFNAPGAHRYRVFPHLFAITYSDESQRAAKIAELESELNTDSLSEEFEAFMVIDNGQVVKDQSEVQYADILNLLARRTYDESGNYTVEDFDLSLDADPDDSSKFVAEIGPGKAYVKGFEINKKISTRLKLDRARTTRNNDRVVKTMGTLPYFVLQNANNSESGIECGVIGGTEWIRPERQETVYILNTKIDPASPSVPDIDTDDSAVIAQTRAVSISREEEYVSLHLEDVGDGADEIRNAKSIVAYRDDGSRAWVNLAQRKVSSGERKTSPIFGGDIRPLIVKMSDKIIQSTGDHRHQMVERLEPVADGSGNISVSLPSGKEFKTRRPFVVAYNSSNPSQVVDVSQLEVVNWSPTSIEVSGGDIVPGASYVIYTRVELIGTTAAPGSKDLGSTKTKQITANSFNTIDGVETDEVVLEEDLYDIVAVYQTSNLDTTNDTYNGQNVYKLTTKDLLKLEFDDGQSDIQYEPGKITGWRKLWNLNKATKNDPTDYTIEYRRFDHQTAGKVHTVDSYEFSNDEQRKIPRYQSNRFGRIDLISCMDFRQTSTHHDGLLNSCILPSSRIEFSETYYVGRIDIIALDKNGEFVIHEGVAADNPTPPSVPEGSMILFKLHIPPYTFSTRDIQIETHKNTRYTMKDISRLEDRIERLEDSVSLSLLEKNAMDMKVTDKKTGFDRFKSGIFVDSFQGLSHAESLDPEFYISVDRVEKTIHCPVEKNNINMELDATTSTQMYANLVTLKPDTTERIIAQNDTATGTVNLNPYLFYTWVGNVELTPAVDTWHETRYLPQRNVTVGSWDPPEGFNPNWRIDDIEVNWVGVPPDPNPLPPNPSPPQNSEEPDVLRQTDIMFSTNEQRELMLLIASGAPQEEIDVVAEQVAEQLQNDERRQFTLQGAAVAARNAERASGGLDFDIDQELVDQALRIVGFDGSTGTSSSLGSGSVLSNSEARSIAQNIGPEEFENTTNLSELSPQGSRRVGNRLTGNMIQNETESGVGNQAVNQNTGVQQQTITEVRDVLTRHTETNKEDRVLDRSEIFWMREQEIEFDGEGFRPGMLVNGYLDNKRVEIVPDGSEFEDNSGSETRVRVNSNGKVKGFFKIPPRKFTTGTKVFLLIDDEETSQGSADFTSKGMLTTRQEVITTTRSVSTRQVFRTQNTEIIEQPPFTDMTTREFKDPIAQSFMVTTKGGCLASGVTVYFSTKAGDFRDNSLMDTGSQTLAEFLEDKYPGHPTDPIQYIKGSEEEYLPPVTLYLVEVRDGTPTSNIVPLSSVTLQASQVNSDPEVPQNGATEFRFNDPIYLEEEGEYAFIVITSSKEYNVWMTELGEIDIFDGTEGVGVAEQPYLGSLFKSQNSSTWTPEQTQTLTFKLKRYNYSDNQSGSVTFIDSKFEDTLVHDSQGNRVNRGLYASEFTGNPHDERTFVSTVFPMFGEITHGDTFIKWNHKFSDGVTRDLANNKRNVVLDSTSPTNEFVISPNDDYRVVANMSTSKANLSPIVDIDQSRIIAIRNLVKGIEVYDQAPLTFIEGYNADDTGVWDDTNHIYNKTEVFKTTAGVAYIVLVDGVSFSVTDADPAFNDELSQAIADDQVAEAETLGLSIDQNDVGNAGAYVSKPINLKSPADDIRLIMDSSEPGPSYIRPYYRILNHKPKYAIVRQENDDSMDYRVHQDMSGVTDRILYVTTPTPSSTSLGFVKRDINDNENYISINGFDQKTVEVGAQTLKQTVAYFSGLTNPEAFSDANTAARTQTSLSGNFTNHTDYTAFTTNSALLKKEIDKGNDIPVWDDTAAYRKSDIVYYNGAFWYSTGYISNGAVYNSGSSYTAGDFVTYKGSLFLCLQATTGDDPLESPTYWKELTSEYYGAGTVPTDPGSAWERIPATFFKQSQDSIPSDDTSQWRPMVLKTGGFTKNDYSDNSFYESTWVPKTEPGIEFKTFAVKLDFVTEGSRAIVPRAKNLRVIATL